jgi:hypothetical protein
MGKSSRDASDKAYSRVTNFECFSLMGFTLKGRARAHF